MNEAQPGPTPDDATPGVPLPNGPTNKQLRDARRHAHGVQKDSPEAGGDKKARKGRGDKKGRKGKGDPKP